jgi:linoleoyl-CoA desaturase
MKVKFNNPVSSNPLQKAIRDRVNTYFKNNNISKKADGKMLFKSLVLFGSYFGLYFTILLIPMPLYAMWMLTFIMGLSLAGIGMSVMHDANHGAYSSHPKINSFLGYSMNLIGGNRFNWIIQHNVKHHTFTNIYGADEDLDNGDVLRLSPYSDWYWFHRFQHYYCWFLYLLGTLSWVTIKDFRQFTTLHKEMGDKKQSYRNELMVLISSKILYYLYMVLIPWLVLDISIIYILIGFLTLHFVAGFILSVTFQLAHIAEHNHHDSAHLKQEFPDSWIVHQIKTTANFSRRSALLNWYLGGLNFQIEHHLFPQICHVHYRKISEIVKEIVQEHGLFYYEHPNMARAIQSHFQTLRKYSMNPAVAQLVES